MKTVTVQAQQKWEYLTVTRHTEATLLAAINEAGQQGWELVNALNYKDAKGNSAWLGFMKRPFSGQASKATAETVASAADHSGSQSHVRPPADDDGDSYDVKAD